MKKELMIIKRMSITILGSFGKIIKALLKLLYLIEQAKNNLIAKLFNKLPRLAKVVTIYTLVVLSAMQVMSMTNPKVIETIVEKVETIEVVNAQEVETEIVEEVEETPKQELVETSCNYSNENACNIYNKSLELGLTENQAIIAIAISAQETGYWKSNLFNNNYNFGGLYYNGFITYENYNEGLESFIKTLKVGYFEKGFDTIEKIGSKWAPVGAQNDPKGLNNNWVPNVTSIYNSYLAK